MKDDDICYIRLYTNNRFVGKFILRYGDARQINYWWINYKKNNYVTFEKINNF